MNVILVIADDRSLCESLRAALPETDLVLFEGGVEAALRRLIAVRADVLLLDDGPNLGRHAMARLHEAVPEVPVVALSGRGDDETLAALTLAGARSCIVKPFSCEVLKNAVDAAARGAARTREDVTSVRPSNGRTMHAPVEESAALAQHQTALRWLSRIAGHIRDPLRLSQDLAYAATDVFGAVRSAVLLDVEGAVRIVASQGMPPNVSDSVRLTFNTGLMRWFETHACLFDCAANGDMAAAAKEMQVLGTRLGAPLMCGGRVVGALLLGDRASGTAYSFHERELFTVVGRCASTALENARLYQDISRHEGRLHAILANVSAGVVHVAPDKTIVLMNQSAERILQVRAADVVGRSVQKIGSAFADVALRALAENKPILRQEVRDAAVDAVLGLSATPLGPEGVVVVFSRLPEEAVSKEEIAYSPFWEYFAERVGQEIKNPLVAINTYAQLLPRKYDLEDFRTSFSEIVQKEVARINNVVETLFEFARHPRLVLHRTDINETIRDVLRSFEKVMQERAIELETVLDPDKPGADVDPTAFCQAVSNVVQNSVDAMSSGGKLKVSTRGHDGRCEVVVSDTGPGIPEQDALLVFMPLFSTKEQGMGLGLTIADRIMREHNGNLKLLPSTGSGSAFAFEIPLAGNTHANNSRH